jgi:hypothetical protein
MHKAFSSRDGVLGGTIHDVSLHIHLLLREGSNEPNVLEPYHLSMEIFYVKGPFKGQLILDSKEVLLKCSQGLYPERTATRDGNQMGTIERDRSACMNGNRYEDLVSCFRFSRNDNLKGREITGVGKGKVRHTFPERLGMGYTGPL